MDEMGKRSAGGDFVGLLVSGLPMLVGATSAYEAWGGWAGHSVFLRLFLSAVAFGCGTWVAAMAIPYAIGLFVAVADREPDGYVPIGRGWIANGIAILFALPFGVWACLNIAALAIDGVTVARCLVGAAQSLAFGGAVASVSTLFSPSLVRDTRRRRAAWLVGLGLLSALLGIFVGVMDDRGSVISCIAGSLIGHTLLLGGPAFIAEWWYERAHRRAHSVVIQRL